jgi:hypothetical protein
MKRKQKEAKAKEATKGTPLLQCRLPHHFSTSHRFHDITILKNGAERHPKLYLLNINNDSVLTSFNSSTHDSVLHRHIISPINSLSSTLSTTLITFTTLATLTPFNNINNNLTNNNNLLRIVIW